MSKIIAAVNRIVAMGESVQDTIRSTLQSFGIQPTRLRCVDGHPTWMPGEYPNVLCTFDRFDDPVQRQSLIQALTDAIGEDATYLHADGTGPCAINVKAGDGTGKCLVIDFDSFPECVAFFFDGAVEQYSVFLSQPDERFGSGANDLLCFTPGQCYLLSRKLGIPVQTFFDAQAGCKNGAYLRISDAVKDLPLGTHLNSNPDLMSKLKALLTTELS